MYNLSIYTSYITDKEVCLVLKSKGCSKITFTIDNCLEVDNLIYTYTSRYNNKDIIFSCENILRMDSMAVGVLLRNTSLLRSRGNIFTLTNLNTRTLTLLKLLCISEFFGVSRK